MRGANFPPCLDDRGQRRTRSWRSSTPSDERSSELDRVLATVLFTDIVGSTDKACETRRRLVEGAARAPSRTTVRAMLARYRGTEVKTTGDGFLATFDGPARAVKCAQAICEAVKPLGLEVRAGCHTGEIELLGADVGGIAVHIGARVARPRRPLRGPRQLDRQGPRRRLGAGLRGPRRARAQGRAGSWRLYAATSHADRQHSADG